MEELEQTADVRNDNEVAGQVDPFNHPIPGESLTAEPGNNQYESAPEETDPEVVIQSVINFFNDPEQKEMLLTNLAVGMPVEAVVQSFALGGVAEGKFSPDVAELIKPALTLHIVNLAMEENIPVTIFTDEVMSQEDQQELSEIEARQVMEESRPELAQAIRGQEFEADLSERAGRAQEKVSAKRKINRRVEEAPVESDGSFIDMGAV